MSVYVDNLVGGWGGTYRGKGAAQAARVGSRNGHQWCHLVADTADELHAFAGAIGLKRQWSQTSRSGVDHYDLTPGRRARAVQRGAIEIDRRRFVELTRASAKGDHR